MTEKSFQEIDASRQLTSDVLTGGGVLVFIGILWFLLALFRL